MNPVNYVTRLEFFVALGVVGAILLVLALIVLKLVADQGALRASIRDHDAFRAEVRPLLAQLTSTMARIEGFLLGREKHPVQEVTE